MFDWMTTRWPICIGGRSLPWQLLCNFSLTFASCFVSAAVTTVFGSRVSSSLRQGMSVLWRLQKNNWLGDFLHLSNGTLLNSYRAFWNLSHLPSHFSSKCLALFTADSLRLFDAGFFGELNSCSISCLHSIFLFLLRSSLYPYLFSAFVACLGSGRSHAVC